MTIRRGTFFCDASLFKFFFHSFYLLNFHLSLGKFFVLIFFLQLLVKFFFTYFLWKNYCLWVTPEEKVEEYAIPAPTPDKMRALI